MVNEKKRTPKFKRTDFSKYSKLGVRRKNKQVYRRPKGIDNKINKKMKGHLRRVMIGFKNESKSRGLIDGLEPVMVFNVDDLSKVEKGQIVIVGKVGMKKKIEIATKGLEMKIRFNNLNSKKFLESVNEIKKEKEEKKSKMDKKKKAKDKKAKETEKKEAEAEDKEKGKEDKGDEKVKSEDDKSEDVKDKKKENTKKVKAEKKEVQTNNYGRGK
jgi:large subunit ribosomal protein L32e